MSLAPSTSLRQAPSDGHGSTTKGTESMPWETKGSERYYYRKRRINGRVVSEYVGRGAEDEQIAAADELARDARAEARAAQQARLAEFEALDQDVKAFGVMVDTLMRLALEANGYHQHKGQWRRKRGSQ